MTDRAGTAGPALALAIVCFIVFNLNGREIGSYDSQPAKLLAVELVTRHSLALGHVVGRTPALAERPAFVRDLHGNYRTAYPLPSALAGGVTAWVLSTMRLVDLEAPLASSFVAKLTASALSALAVAFAVVAASRRVSVRMACVVALAFGLGTNIWAEVSQTLWQQETGLCALMAAVALLTTERAGIRRMLAVGLALGLAGWARPQLAPAVVILAISMPVRWGRRAIAGWVPIALAAAVAIGVNLVWFGRALGAVPLRESLHAAVHGVPGSVSLEVWKGAAGLLVSPSRGLLIFSPIVVFSAAGWRRAAAEGRRADLAWCLAAAGAQFVLYSGYAVWWGGHSYGPRYALDMLPELIPVAAAGLPAIVGRPLLRGGAVLALAWSVYVAGLGAFVYPNDRWNIDPVDVDRHHQRLWDWRDSQILRCARSPRSPQNFTFTAPGALTRH